MFQSFLRELKNEAEAEKAVTLFRENYANNGKFENSLYEGIGFFLQTLKNNGHQLYIATNKPQIFANQILTHFGINQYFDGIYGTDLKNHQLEKDKLIESIITIDKNELNQYVLVGDTKFDWDAAHKNKIACILVNYGFGKHPELVALNPLYLADDVKNLQLFLTDAH